MTQPATSPAPELAAAGAVAVVDRLAVDLVALYTAAEQQLISEETRLARRALVSADLQARLVLLLQMRRVAQQIAARLHLRSYPLAEQIGRQAALEGEQAAALSLRRLVAADKKLVLTPHGLAAATQITLELVDKLDAVQHRILRFPDDAYRALTSDAASVMVRGHLTPQQAQAQAWRELTAKGITGFVDRKGRRWNLASYVEMAVRTAGQRAFNASHLARLTALGVQYVTVNHDGHPCPLCLPWEGRVLSIGVSVDPDVDVAATLAQAIAAGLFHPNCRHVLIAYTPGISKLGRASHWTDADERRYKATQHLHYLERQVRAGKYQQAAALTPLDARRAGRLIRARQAEIRAHVEKHNLVRRSRREQLDLGNRVTP